MRLLLATIQTDQNTQEWNIQAEVIQDLLKDFLGYKRTIVPFFRKTNIWNEEILAKYFSAHLSNLHSLVSVGGGGGLEGGGGGTQSVIRACLVLAHGDGINFWSFASSQLIEEMELAQAWVHRPELNPHTRLNLG